MKRRNRGRNGTGAIYKRNSIWWIAYRGIDGKQTCESSGSETRDDARLMLQKKLAEVTTGKPTGKNVEKTSLEELIAMFLADRKKNHRREDESAASKLRLHLNPYFGADCRARDLTTDRITAFTANMQQQGYADATINRTLAGLKRAFKLAARAGRVASVPYIELIEEHNAREGFIEQSQFNTLLAKLPDDLRDPVLFLWLSAWRVNEMRSLTWDSV
jgi:integrase